MVIYMLKKIRNLFASAGDREPTPEENRLQRLLDDANDQIDYLISQNQSLNKEYKSLESELSRAMEQVVVLQTYKDQCMNATARMHDMEDILNTRPKEIFIMAPEHMARMEQNLEAGIVTKDTTPQQTGYLLGIQRALAYLRKNHVAVR